MKKILVALFSAFLLSTVVGCADLDTGGDSKAKAADKVVSSSEDTASEDETEPAVVEEPAEPETYKPTKSDFKPIIKVTSRSCFGSAGCNIEYKVGLKWMGPNPAPRLDKSYDVYYRVTGGDMGTSTDTITVNPKLRYSVIEGYDSTGNVGDVLTASVIRIGNASGF